MLRWLLHLFRRKRRPPFLMVTLPHFELRADPALFREALGRAQAALRAEEADDWKESGEITFTGYFDPAPAHFFRCPICGRWPVTEIGQDLVRCVDGHTMTWHEFRASIPEKDGFSFN